MLHLSETATVAVPPDEVASTLRAEAIAASAADAQQRVNAAMADALDRAHRVAGVEIESGGYTVWRIGPAPQDRTERWQAGQSVSIRGHDGAAVLKLVGELQQRGLAVNQLGWQLSEDATRDARQKALALAVKALRGRADAAAALLDLQFDSFRDVRLDAPRPMPVARMMAPMAAAAAPAPPAIEASDVRVSATAEAEVALRPR